MGSVKRQIWQSKKPISNTNEVSGGMVLVSEFKHETETPEAGIPDAPNDASAYVRSGLAWVVGYTKSAIDSLLGGKENTITGTTSADYYRGDKTFQPLNKSAVGLGNVDNTSDVNKPISTATQTALDLKLNKNKFFGEKNITITGVTVPTVVVSVLIPANRFTANEFIEIIVHSNKTTTETAIAIELYHDVVINGTSNALANISLTTTNRNCHFNRWLNLNGTSLKSSLPANSGFLSPQSSASATSLTATFNPTIDNYLTLVVNGLTNVSESYILNFLQIRSYSL